MQLLARVAWVSLAAALSTLGSMAYAGGFAVPAQSTSVVGNAFAGAAAAAEDASTVWYNPAGMGMLQGKNASQAVQAVRPSFKFQNTGSTAPAGTGEGGDGGDWGFPLQLYGAMSLGDNWRLGVAVNIPFGLQTNYDAGWRGQFTALKSTVQAINVNPAVAYKVNEAFWIGGGVNVQRFSTELTNLAPGPLGTATLKAHDTGWGFNLGALYQVTPRTRVGAAYRSAISYTLGGDATFSGGGGAFNSGAKADLTVPETLSLNIFSGLWPDSKWDVMAGTTWTRWSRIQTVTVTRTSASVLGPAGSTAGTLTFNWRDTFLFAIGANYQAHDKLKLRFGLAYDPAASNDVTRTPRLPDERRIIATMGAQYVAPWKGGSFDFAYAHDFVKDASINTAAPPAPGTLVGTFKNKADVLSLQYNHQF